MSIFKFESGEDDCAGLSFTKILVKIPPAMPVKKATTGRNTAKGHPSIEYVAKIESTPVLGVEIRNELDAPFNAPFLKNEIPVGITPQEHNGMGIPSIDALKADRKLGFPKIFIDVPLRKINF